MRFTSRMVFARDAVVGLERVQSTRVVRMNKFPKGTLASLSFALRPYVSDLRKTSTWPSKALASLSFILLCGLTVQHMMMMMMIPFPRKARVLAGATRAPGERREEEEEEEEEDEEGWMEEEGARALGGAAQPQVS